MLRVKDLAKMPFISVKINKSRTFLTVLGIVIGIASIISILSIGDGAKNLIVGEIKTFGSNNVFVVPGKKPKGFIGIGGTLLNDSLKMGDYLALKDSANIPDAKKIVPYVFGSVNSTYQSEIYSSMVIGSSVDIKNIFSIKLSEGNFWSNEDIKLNQRYAVIGDTIKDKIFGLNNAIGKKIKLNNIVFVVVGVMKKKGKSFGSIDIDKAIIVPYTSAQKYIFGIKYFNRIAVEASSPLTIKNVKQDIETTLRTRHHITDPDKDDFFVETQEDIAKNVDSIMNILKILIATVAGISLIVGGVGIMNVMFVSVTERTKEIGLRKALGAQSSDILRQFLFESIFITFIGGLFGIIFGILFTYLASWGATRFAGLNFPFIISIQGIIFGVIIPIIIGLVFGILPAKEASKKSPMEAILYK